jgi:hypothetical protein
MTVCAPFVRKHAQNEGFKKIVDKSMFLVYIVLYGEHRTKMLLECKKILQLIFVLE